MNMKFINEDDISRMKLSVSKLETNGNAVAAKRVRKLVTAILDTPICVSHYLACFLPPSLERLN